MVGLVRVVSDDPRLLGHNHRVLAYGYDLEGSDLALQIYDPNWQRFNVPLLRVARHGGTPPRRDTPNAIADSWTRSREACLNSISSCS